MRISVVGLGPGPIEWLSAAALDRLRAPGARHFARTAAHPALAEAMRGLAFETFDDLYESAATLEVAHAEMLERMLAEPTDAVLALPGDGMLGEALLQQLRARDDVRLEVVPGIPLGVGALAAADLATADGAQCVEATSLGGSGIDLLIELNPRWPAVVTGVFSPGVAADLKLALQRVYPDEHEICLVAHPGLADQRVERVSLAELDRARVSFDHLTHVVLPPVTSDTPTGSAHTLRAIVARLRAPQIGCPWDLEQTHQSLTPYVIEEAYEAVEAIQDDDMPGLADELGDVLLQVALHAEIADQESFFEWNDVVRGLGEKLVRRHPHVFGDVHVGGASDVVRNWDQLKAQERTSELRASALDGIPRSLPGLKMAAEQSRKAEKAGFEWPTRQGTLDKVREELAELLEASSLAERREELGDLLWIIAKLARDDGVDPEDAMRAACAKFRRRFVALEAIARERGWSSMAERPIEDLLAAWSEAKVRTRA